MFQQQKPPGMMPPPNVRGNPQGPPGYVPQASRPQGVGGVVQSPTYTGMPTRPRFNPNAGQGVSRRPLASSSPVGPEAGMRMRPPQLGSKGGDPRQQQAQGGPSQQPPVRPGPPIDFYSAVGGAGSAYGGGVGNAGTTNRAWQMASARNKGNGYG